MEDPSKVNFMTADSHGSGALIPQKISQKEQASVDGQISFGSMAESTLNRISKDEAAQLVNGLSLADSHQSQQTQEMVELLSANGDATLRSLLVYPVESKTTDVKVSASKSDNDSFPKEKISNESGRLLLSASNYQIFQSQETDSIKGNGSRSQGQKVSHSVDALRDEIHERKRKAVAPKREGKLVETREELRQGQTLGKEPGKHRLLKNNWKNSTMVQVIGYLAGCPK